MRTPSPTRTPGSMNFQMCFAWKLRGHTFQGVPEHFEKEEENTHFMGVSVYLFVLPCQAFSVRDELESFFSKDCFLVFKLRLQTKLERLNNA